MKLIVIQALTQILNSKPFEGGLSTAAGSFKLAGFKKLISSQMEEIENSRKSLLEKYGDKDENGELIVDENGGVKILNPQGFNEEWNDLMQTEVEIVVPKFKLAELDGVKMQAFFDIMYDYIEA